LITASIILVLTYIGVAFTRLPRINIDRPAAAFTGAVLMVLLGVLSFQEAVEAVDFNTLALLLGMMILVVVLDRAGLLTYVAGRFLSIGRSPRHLLVAVVVSTAVLSAFLVNDAVVLFFTPVVIRACQLLGANPVPYLIAEAMASNVGSTATIVGNPQNMLIGVSSGISFTRFFMYLLPVAALSAIVLILMVLIFYRREFRSTFRTDMELLKEEHRPNPATIKKVLPILVLTIMGFFLSSAIDVEVPLIALSAGALMLLVSGIRPSEIIRGVDWVLLLFFGGLFVVIGGARQAGVLDFFLDKVIPTADVKGIVSMHLVSAAVSQIVSNVPLTILVIPAIEDVPGDVLWISLAAGSTLGGNATIIGAVANIIVAEGAQRQGVELRFGEFFRVGLAVTVLSLGISVLVLIAEYQLGFLR